MIKTAKFFEAMLLASLVWCFALVQCCLAETIDLAQVSPPPSIWTEEAAKLNHWIGQVIRHQGNKDQLPRETRDLYRDKKIRSLSVDPSGRWVGAATSSVYRIWDLKTGEERLRLRHPSVDGPSEAYHSEQWGVGVVNGATQIATVRLMDSRKGSDILFWDLETGEIIGKTRIDHLVTAMQSSPDGKILVVKLEEAKNSCLIWVEAATGQREGTTSMRSGHSARNMGDPWWNPTPLAYLDSRTVLFPAYGDTGSYVKSYYRAIRPSLFRPDFASQVLKAQPIQDEDENYYRTAGLAASPSSELIAIRRKFPRSDVFVELRRTSDYSEQRRLQFNPSGGILSPMSFSANGSRFHCGIGRDVAVVGTKEKRFVGQVVVETKSGRVLGYYSAFNIIEIPGSDLVFGGGRLFRTSDFAHVATFRTFNHERYWAVVTASGHLYASKELLDSFDRYDKWRDVEDFVRSRQSARLVQLVLAGVPPEVLQQVPKDYQRPTCQLRVVRLTKDSAEIEVASLATGTDITLVEQKLSRRGWPLPDDLKRVTAARKRLTIPFPPGKNEMTLEAVVADSLGVKSIPAMLSVTRPERVQEVQGRLLLLAVGVGQHKYDEYDLIFPAKDVEAIKNALEEQVGVTFAEVVPYVYTDGKATLKNVKAGLEWLTRASTAEDLVIVYFAGHGVRGRRGLYYVPHGGDGQGIQYTCLNWEEVADAISKVKARQVIFLSDVCHAGGFAQSDLAMQGKMVKRIAEVDGVLVFAASGANELAYEHPKWQHGAFTSALLSSLSGEADVNSDDAVSLRELIAHTTEQTRQLTAGKQTPFVGSTANYDEELIIARALPRNATSEAFEQVARPEDASK